jgi:hypothetical protein
LRTELVGEVTGQGLRNTRITLQIRSGSLSIAIYAHFRSRLLYLDVRLARMPLRMEMPGNSDA